MSPHHQAVDPQANDDGDAWAESPLPQHRVPGQPGQPLPPPATTWSTVARVQVSVWPAAGDLYPPPDLPTAVPPVFTADARPQAPSRPSVGVEAPRGLVGAVRTHDRVATPAAPTPSGGLSPRAICWVGAHGGAGATTLAAVVGGMDVGCRWPDPARVEPAHVILVARTHATGMRAASRALNAVREGRHPAGMKVVGLALVADAPGRLPRELIRRVRVLRAAVPVWRVPWIAPWRLGKQTDRLPSQVTKLSALIQKLEQTGIRHPG